MELPGASPTRIISSPVLTFTNLAMSGKGISGNADSGVVGDAGMSVVFLTAEWRHLVMLNYEVTPTLLEPYVPAGTELDLYQGMALMSIVGFRFLNTKVMGWSVPRHKDFEEVNLRFYVRRNSVEGWRRGVVFIRELVPRWAVAMIARYCYGEPYQCVPMRHSLEQNGGGLEVRYAWRRQGVWESIRATAVGSPQVAREGSLEEFITEHYWGYTARGPGCSEYQVEHPRWRVWRAEGVFNAEASTLYGSTFAKPLSNPPMSAFIAEGSPVVVRRNQEVNEAGLASVTAPSSVG